MTDFQLRYIQTSSRNAVNKKLFLTSLLFLARSYHDVQHAKFSNVNNIRNSLIQEIENYYPDFNQLDSIAKLIIILNPSQDILSNVVDYIKQSMELRE
jgi:hypothetical protein